MIRDKLKIVKSKLIINPLINIYKLESFSITMTIIDSYYNDIFSLNIIFLLCFCNIYGLDLDIMSIMKRQIFLLLKSNL